MLQEHNGMSLLAKNGVLVPPFGVARSEEEAYKQALNIGFLLNPRNAQYANQAAKTMWSKPRC